MTNFEQNLLARIESLEIEVKRLRSEKNKESFTPERIAYFDALPLDATVGKDYVSFRFGCSQEAVIRGRAGTYLLRTKRVSEKPLKFIKRDVDAAWRKYTKSMPETAAEERHNAKPVKRRKSLITKNNKGATVS